MNTWSITREFGFLFWRIIAESQILDVGQNFLILIINLIDMQYQIFHFIELLIFFVLQSFQPSYTEARLLFCSGQYPYIVVMHAMQLSNLFILASNAHPSWIQDFALFTHSQIKREF